MLMLAVLLLPQREAAASPEQRAPASAYAFDADEGGSCGESEEPESETKIVDCGAQREARFDEPILISLMRQIGIEMDHQSCEALLRDIYAELSCEGRGPDCGQLSNGMPPGPGPKLAAGSSSARSTLSSLELGEDAGRDALASAVRPLSSRDLQPPVPPPR